MCEGRVLDVRDGIISRSIWAIGKLKRVQNNRDGGANMVLYKSLKNLYDYWCEGNWTLVIQARGFIVLRHREGDRFFEGGGNHRGSKGLIKDGCKQTNQPASRSAQDLRTRPVIPSGPAAFLTITLFSSLRTSSSSNAVITWSSLLCLLLPDVLIGRVALPPLHSRRCLTRQPATDLLSPLQMIYFQRNRWSSVPATSPESH